jgi:hypothetical protein
VSIPGRITCQSEQYLYHIPTPPVKPRHFNVDVLCQHKTTPHQSTSAMQPIETPQVCPKPAASTKGKTVTTINHLFHHTINEFLAFHKSTPEMKHDLHMPGWRQNA